MPVSTTASLFPSTPIPPIHVVIINTPTTQAVRRLLANKCACFRIIHFLCSHTEVASVFSCTLQCTVIASWPKMLSIEASPCWIGLYSPSSASWIRSSCPLEFLIEFLDLRLAERHRLLSRAFAFLYYPFARFLDKLETSGFDELFE